RPCITTSNWYARLITVTRSKNTQLHLQLVQARYQDPSPLQGPRAHHGIRPRPRCAGAGDGHGAGALQRAEGQGTGRARSFGRHHPAGRSSGRVRVRAAVDRVGIDSHGRSTKVQIRRVRKGDLAKARDVLEQTFTDFLERQLGTRPRQPFGGAQYVHHRWLMEPWGCFVAEEDQSKIVGATLAVTWGA